MIMKTQIRLLSIAFLAVVLLLTGCFNSKPRSGFKYEQNAASLLKARYGIEFTFSKVVGQNDDGFDVLEFYPTINSDIKFKYHNFINEHYPKGATKYDYDDNFLGTLFIEKYAELYSEYLEQTVDASAIQAEFQSYDTREVNWREFLRTTDYVITVNKDNIQEVATAMKAIIIEAGEFPELERYVFRDVSPPFRYDNQKNPNAAYYLSRGVLAYGSADELLTNIVEDMTQRYQYMCDIGEIEDTGCSND